MARHRQRARDRKLSQPRHENVSGELEHASGEVEEFDAALVAGAGGEPGGLADETEPAAEAEAEAEAEPDFEDVEDEDEDGAGALPARRRAERAARRSGPQPGGSRALNFLRASWSELQRVQWPDRRHVAQATAVVLAFVAITGGYLGLADVVAQRVVDFII